MDYQNLDDSALFRLVQHSDPQAFRVFYDRYVNLVFKIAITIVSRRELAEEIVQDVFIKIWTKSHTYQPEQSRLNTWLSTITRNRSIDEFRKKKLRVERDRVAGIVQLQEEDSPDPEGWVELQSDQLRVRKALQQIPEEQREPILLAYFYGLSQQQIANQLDQPLGTIKTRIRLGMQKLRGLLVSPPETHPK